MTEMKPYMTEKRKYELPAMRVVELQRHVPLICTSGVGATNSIEDWGDGDTTNGDIYM